MGASHLVKTKRGMTDECATGPGMMGVLMAVYALKQVEEPIVRSWVINQAPSTSFNEIVKGYFK